MTAAAAVAPARLFHVLLGGPRNALHPVAWPGLPNLAAALKSVRD